MIWNKEYKIIKKSGLFDAGYYLKSYEIIGKEYLLFMNDTIDFRILIKTTKEKNEN